MVRKHRFHAETHLHRQPIHKYFNQIRLGFDGKSSETTTDKGVQRRYLKALRLEIELCFGIPNSERVGLALAPAAIFAAPAARDAAERKHLAAADIVLRLRYQKTAGSSLLGFCYFVFFSEFFLIPMVMRLWAWVVLLGSNGPNHKKFGQKETDPKEELTIVES